MTTPKLDRPAPSWQRRLHEIIFEADTPAGKAFDFALLWFITLSVLAVMLESVTRIRIQYGTTLYYIEWAFTLLLPWNISCGS